MVMTNRNMLRKAPRSRAQLAAAKAIDELRDGGALDSLFSKIDAGELQLTGEGGFVPGLIKAALERGLQVELTEHLGLRRATRKYGSIRTPAMAPRPSWSTLRSASWI